MLNPIWVIPTTTHCLKPLMAYAKLRLSKKMTWKGWEDVEHATLVTGLTTSNCLSLSATYRLMNTKITIIDKPSRLRQHDSN